MINKLLDKLPDLYNKTEGSNVYNLIKLAADQIEKGEQILQLITDWRDIDQAQGNVLDKIGKEVGQTRGGLDDIKYRQKIKIKIRANLSGGEIETLNSICTLLLGDRFDGIEEGWTLLPDHPIGPKPAMLLFSVFADGVNFGLPMDKMDLITGGGVADNWHLKIHKKIKIKTEFTKSSEAFNVFDFLLTMSQEFNHYEQGYLYAGGSTSGGTVLTTMEGLI